MADRLRNVALTVGDRVHPLMGPIFTSRPDASAVGERCSLCLEAAPSDIAIVDSRGSMRFVCMSHELLLSRAFQPGSGADGATEYAAYILEHILAKATRPWWMPGPVYRPLVKRAAKKARLLALATVLGMANPLTYAAPTT